MTLETPAPEAPEQPAPETPAEPEPVARDAAIVERLAGRRRTLLRANAVALGA